MVALWAKSVEYRVSEQAGALERVELESELALIKNNRQKIGFLSVVGKTKRGFVKKISFIKLRTHFTNFITL